MPAPWLACPAACIASRFVSSSMRKGRVRMCQILVVSLVLSLRLNSLLQSD
ncbi:hypothetical protein ABIA51_001167 [Erwinia aphidicola]